MDDVLTIETISDLFWEENLADLGWRIDKENCSLVLLCLNCDESVIGVSVRYGALSSKLRKNLTNSEWINECLKTHSSVRCEPYDEDNPKPVKAKNWISPFDREKLHQYLMEQILNAKDLKTMERVMSMKEKVEKELERECPAGYKIVIEYPATGGISVGHEPMFTF